jgi:5,10-methylenetetrahydromethanopterin reductase
MVPFGLNRGSYVSVTEAVDMSQWAEDRGFKTVWIGESRLAANAVVHLTLAAANTKQISIGSAVLPYRTRNAALLAVTFKTLDDVAPNRIKMGLGAWWEPLATRVGLPNTKPVTAMREIITVAKHLLAGETVSFEGEFVQVDGIRFDAPQDEGGRNYPVPIYIGAVGMKMMQLVGEIADGVLLDVLLPPSYNIQAMEALKSGGAISGRSLEEIDRPQFIACAVNNEDPDLAVDEIREFLTRYIAQQPHIAQHCGADPELVAAIKAELGYPASPAEVKRAMRLVPTELVRSVSACGTATEALEMVEKYVETGCTEAVFTPIGHDTYRTLEQLVAKAGSSRRVAVR